MRSGRYESSSEGSNVATAITFLLIGLGAGALAGLLLAPKSGKLLRRDLKRGYEDAREAIDEWTEEAKDRVRDATDRGVEMAEGLRDAAREKVEPLRRAIKRS